MIYEKINHIFHKLIRLETSPARLALSVSLGTFIAICPFLGFHTIMLFAFSWLLGLNMVVTFAVAHLINNPWTMIPIFMTDHWFGHWLLSHWGATGWIDSNPWWFHFINNKIQYFGFSSFSLWAFIIGGNLLALSFSIMLYPISKKLFARLMMKRKTA